MGLNQMMIKLIKKYQVNKRKIGRCKHYPSCSVYSIGCYEKFNFFKASLLSSYRIIRCNPLSWKVYDPIPLSKEEKRIRKLFNEKAMIIDTEIIKLNNLDGIVCYIWETHFNTNEYVDFSHVSNDDMMLFFAKIDRVLYLTKKKALPFPKKEVKKYISSFLTSDLSKFRTKK